jgi:hypothetical protein
VPIAATLSRRDGAALLCPNKRDGMMKGAAARPAMRRKSRRFMAGQFATQQLQSKQFFTELINRGGAGTRRFFLVFWFKTNKL